jgi:hypothetical protein
VETWSWRLRRVGSCPSARWGLFNTTPTESSINFNVSLRAESVGWEKSLLICWECDDKVMSSGSNDEQPATRSH